MCSDAKLLIILLLMTFVSCNSYRKVQRIRSGEVAVSLSVADEKPLEEEQSPVIDSIRGTLADGPLIMNAIRDDETGEMVATDVINASRVVARFRNVPERAGYVSIGFDVVVPEGMADSKWQLRIDPKLNLNGDTTSLESLHVTGKRYRAAQMRGYERYRRFLASIITDTTEFINVNQLEIFLMRHYPETYAMKTDSSFVPEPLAQNLFGVTQQEALRHYTDRIGLKKNENRLARTGKMFHKLVKDPIRMEGVRLDTVLLSDEGGFVYRYIHTFRSRLGLKKAVVSLKGGLFEDGHSVAPMTFPDDITFYISSLSTLVDDRPKFRRMIVERRVSDNTKALIDFSTGCSQIDTLLGDNASELKRIRECMAAVFSRSEYALDSLVIVASCSPEGRFEVNRSLSMARSEAVKEYIAPYVPEEFRDGILASELPENWEQFTKLVANDSLLTDDVKRKILGLTDRAPHDPDGVEYSISRLPQYRYLREKVYPKLRSVRFDFYLHRVGMKKDTVHTTELDSVYMSGLLALKELDYRKAVSILRPYDDYNAALAFMSADYNHSALDVLERLDDTQPKVCYLKAMVLSRLGLFEEALKYYSLCIAYDPYLQYRANLDPEMFRVVNEYKSINPNKDEF